MVDSAKARLTRFTKFYTKQVLISLRCIISLNFLQLLSLYSKTYGNQRF